MTSGGYTKTEAWNLQLQGKVRRLEVEIDRLRVAYKLAVGRWPEPAPEPPSITEEEIDALLKQEGAPQPGAVSGGGGDAFAAGRRAALLEIATEFDGSFKDGEWHPWASRVARTVSDYCRDRVKEQEGVAAGLPEERSDERTATALSAWAIVNATGEIVGLRELEPAKCDLHGTWGKDCRTVRLVQAVPSSPPTIREALEEMVNASAAMMRVINNAAEEKADIFDDLEDELKASGVKNGFGARARALLSLTQGG